MSQSQRTPDVMAVTPFLNKAATVLVMAPIAAIFAKRPGHAPDAYLMAVAVGVPLILLTWPV